MKIFQKFNIKEDFHQSKNSNSGKKKNLNVFHQLNEVCTRAKIPQGPI